jgi:RND family efflux transporter MFP subunit
VGNKRLVTVMQQSSGHRAGGGPAANWVLAVAAGLAMAACSEDAPPPKPAETVVPVTLAVAAPSGTDRALQVSGTVRLKREAALSFNTPGRIAQIMVREGDMVRAGTVLARLDPTSLAAASASAKAEAARAEADYQRLAGLYAKGWVTAPRVESARAAAAAAQARVSQAGFDVGLATIRAPSSGVVLRRPAEPGQIAQPGQSVIEIGEIASGFMLDIPMADSDLSRLRVGQPAEVRVPAVGAAAIPATIAEIGARGADGTGTFRVRLALAPVAGLRSGQIGAASLRLPGSGGGSTVRVPATAVFSARADEGFVYAYDAAAGRVRLRQVALGPLGDDGLVITGGLAAGDRVVTSGPDRLRNGMQVRVQPASVVPAGRS